VKYCSDCGAGVVSRIPEGDNRLRHCCPECGGVFYQNPKIVVGTIPVWEDRILICKRAIEPRHGYWTTPAGFLELGEAAEQGAARETLEEAGAAVSNLEMFSILNITHVGQVYVMYRARLDQPRFAPGDESLEVRLAGEDDIPWDDIAFKAIRKSLELFFEDRKIGQFGVHSGEISREKIEISRRMGLAEAPP
jgi:ADP-ribose pyrophosphatase YjhB (NUDIX family)